MGLLKISRKIQLWVCALFLHYKQNKQKERTLHFKPRIKNEGQGLHVTPLFDLSCKRIIFFCVPCNRSVDCSSVCFLLNRTHIEYKKSRGLKFYFQFSSSPCNEPSHSCCEQWLQSYPGTNHPSCDPEVPCESQGSGCPVHK